MQNFLLNQQHVFGLALNYRDQLAAWDAAFHEPPYKVPPQHPVLYIQPPSTFNQSGYISVPPADSETPLCAGPGIGIVLGKTCCRLTPENALDAVAGLVAFNDYSAPVTSYYRPDIRGKCRDGSLSVSKEMLALPEKLADVPVSLRINGAEKQRFSAADWQRDLTQILVELTDFMLLSEGDVILTGSPNTRFTVQPSDHVEVHLGEVVLIDELVAEGEQ